jgi:hypothetical protein
LFLGGEVAVIETGQTPPLDLHAQLSLDLADHVGIVGPGESESLSGLLGPAGPSDAV